MDFEREVKKVYPNAEIDWMKKRPFKTVFDAKLEFSVIRKDEKGKIKSLSKSHDTKLEAWEEAYNLLK